jgi:cytochrome c-type biogenesis protein CcmH/NrfF
VRVAAPLVVLAVALVIGSGAFSGKPQTPGQRAAAIEAVVRCPSCIDVSVAQSSETTALAVRHEIERQVARGTSTGRIEQTLVSQYGQNIMLVPPDSGGFAVIYVVPIVLAVAAVVTVAVFFWRRARQFTAAGSPPVGIDVS